MSPSLSPRCCLPVASHFFFCSPIIFNSSPRCFLPDVVAPLSPSCFPVVFRMSKGCGLPLVSHCPAVVSRFLAVSRTPTFHPVVSIVLQIWSSDCLPMVPQFVPDMLSHLSPTTSSCLPDGVPQQSLNPRVSQLPPDVLFQLSPMFPLALKPSLVLGCEAGCLHRLGVSKFDIWMVE